MDDGYFNGLKRTPIESVRYIDYSQTVRVLALKNTGI